MAYKRSPRRVSRQIDGKPTVSIPMTSSCHRRSRNNAVSRARFVSLSGNLCPEGSVIKATSIDPDVIDEDGVYRKRGKARVFTSEQAAIAAIKGQTQPEIKAGRRDCLDRPWTARMRHGRDLPNHFGTEVPFLWQGCRSRYRREVFWGEHGSLYRTCRSRSTCRWTDRQGS